LPANPLKASFGELLTKALENIAVLDQAQLRQLGEHYDLLVRWNARMNLTSIRSMEEAVLRHYAESIFLGTLIPPEATTLLDVGSGAGFPGIPIAVMRPGLKVTLAESNHRKAVFLQEAVRDMPDVNVVARRAEELEGDWHWVVSRAVRPQEVCKIALKVGQGVGLLMGAADTEALPMAVAWASPVFLPWGDRRVAILGRVPRGTSSP